MDRSRLMKDFDKEGVLLTRGDWSEKVRKEYIHRAVRPAGA